MNKFWVKKLKAKQQDVFFTNTLKQYLQQYLANANYTDVFVLYDENTVELCNVSLSTKHHTIVIKSGEKHKNSTTVNTIWKYFFAQFATRNSLLIVVGGGVLCDIGGYAAANYMRGIDCIYVPTSLMAMVDASIGGKTAINFESHKNIIGLFAPAKQVIINTDFLKSLSKKEMLSGQAEMLKHGLIMDKKYWNDCNIFFNHQIKLKVIWEKLIYRSIAIKLSVIKKDFKELGLRKILNAGHTVGHAIESTSLNKSITHGHAVALGIIYESYISNIQKKLSTNELIDICENVQQLYNFKLQFISSLDVNLLWTKMQHDKKNTKTQIMAALLNTIGSCSWDNSITLAELKKAHQQVLKFIQHGY